MNMEMYSLSLTRHALQIKKMIRKRNNIDERFFVRVNSSYDPYRLVHQLPLAVNFHFCFRRFLYLSNFPIEGIGSR